MRLSVALCTYHGERFLPDQLASIASQSRPPDELVVCDDASTDATSAVLREYAAAAPFPVRVYRNPGTLGATGNFARAIGLCTGGVIALCDQDDVWAADKLAVVERTLAGAPAAGAVVSDAELVDEDLEPLGASLWQAVGIGGRERRLLGGGAAVAALARRNLVTGAAMAFRAEYKPLVLPIPTSWHHDAWIALLIGAVSPFALVAAPLLRYRQHGRQQVGAPGRGLLAEYRRARGNTAFGETADRYALALDRLRGWPGAGEDAVRTLAGKVDHARARARMRAPGVRRLPVIAREVWAGNYARYSRGWKSVAQDLFL